MEAGLRAIVMRFSTLLIVLMSLQVRCFNNISEKTRFTTAVEYSELHSLNLDKILLVSYIVKPSNLMKWTPIDQRIALMVTMKQTATGADVLAV